MHKKLKLAGTALVGIFALTACSFLPVSELKGEENQREFLQKVQEMYSSMETSELNVKANGDAPLDGKITINFDLQVDGELSQITYSANDAKFAVFNAADSTYAGDGESWYKVDSSLLEGLEGLTGEEIKSPFEDDADDIEFAYNGLVDCDDARGGKCHQYTLQENDVENTYTIDPREYYIYSQKTVRDDGEEATFNFTYGDVSLSEPSDADELSESDAQAKLLELFAPLFGEENLTE